MGNGAAVANATPIDTTVCVADATSCNKVPECEANPQAMGEPTVSAGERFARVAQECVIRGLRFENSRLHTLLEQQQKTLFHSSLGTTRGFHSGSLEPDVSGRFDEAYEEALAAIGGAATVRTFKHRSFEVKRVLRQRLLEQEGTERPIQDASFHCLTFDDLYEDASRKRDIFEDELSVGCEELRIEKGILAKIEIGPIKKRERALVKAKIKYGGDFSPLCDLLRATILFDSLDDLYSSLEFLISCPRFMRDSTHFVAFEDRFIAPLAGGYRDCQLMLRVHGHLCEVQASVQAFHQAKTVGGGHMQYRWFRELNEHILLAAIEKQGALCQVLCLQRGDPNVVTDMSGLGALHYNALHGQVDVVDMLLFVKANTLAMDKEGRVPLHLAVKNYHFDVASTLLQGMQRDIDNFTKGSNKCMILPTSGVRQLLTLWEWLTDWAEAAVDDGAFDKAKLTDLKECLLETVLQRVRCTSPWGVDRVLDTVAVAILHGLDRTIEMLLECGLTITGPVMYALMQVQDAERVAHLDQILLPHVARIGDARDLLNVVNASRKGIGFTPISRQIKSILAPLQNARELPAPDLCPVAQIAPPLQTVVAAMDRWEAEGTGLAGDWGRGARGDTMLMKVARLHNPEQLRRLLSETDEYDRTYAQLNNLGRSALDIVWGGSLIGGRWEAVLPDERIVASSHEHERYVGEMWRTRLDNDRERCWSPAVGDSSPFLEYRFEGKVRILKILTMGRSVHEGSLGQQNLDVLSGSFSRSTPRVLAYWLDYIDGETGDDEPEESAWKPFRPDFASPTPTHSRSSMIRIETGLNGTWSNRPTDSTFGAGVVEAAARSKDDESQDDFICQFDDFGLSRVVLVPPLECTRLRIRPSAWHSSIHLRCDIHGYPVEVPAWLHPTCNIDLPEKAAHTAMRVLQTVTRLGWVNQHLHARLLALLDGEGACIAEAGCGGRFGDPLLHAAVRLGDSVLVEKLLDLGADWRERNHQGQTALDLIGPTDGLKGAPRRLVGFSSDPALANAMIAMSSADGEFDPDRSRLDAENCWKAQDDSIRQWLQYAFPDPVRIVAVQTLGNAHADERVTAYRLMYAAENQDWRPYFDDESFALDGNTDQQTLNENRVRPIGSCVRLRLLPETWVGHLAMRVDIIGIPSNEFETVTDAEVREALLQSCVS